MKKLKKIIKDYYIFSLFVIPFIMVCDSNAIPDNDIWFLLAVGRGVFTHGFTTVDILTIHEGLECIIQQWGSAAIYWSIYNLFGKYGILCFVFFVLLLLLIVFYNLCKSLNNNKILSVVFTTLVFMFVSPYIVSRPQIITYLLLLIEIFLLEKYTKYNNWKYLVGLLILSIILINTHAAMWMFLFVFLLPYIVNGIYIKNVTVDKYNLLPVLLIGFGMFLVGVINPYGIDSMIYIFNSYNLSGISETIQEMQAINIYYFIFLISLFLIMLLILLQRYVKKFKLDIRHLCFIFGTYYLLLSHAKCYPYFIFVYFVCMSYGMKNVRIPRINSLINSKIFIIFKAFFRATCFMLAISFFVVSSYIVKYFSFTPFIVFEGDVEIMANYIVENYDINKVRLYTSFNDGGYYEFRGIKVYIDPRAELFYKKVNKKEDIYIEDMQLTEEKENGFDYEKFLNKYEFTHLAVYVDSRFDKYLEQNEDYEVVFTLKDITFNNQPVQKLYVLKDIDN